MVQIDRRTLLAGSVLGAAAAALPATPSLAAAPLAGKQGPGFYRFKLGDYEITAITDGVWVVPVKEQMVRNASLEQIQQALSDAYLPKAKLMITFTVLLVNTGSKLILIDTGTGGKIAPAAGAFEGNLAAAGVDPKAIDTVLISHLHFDHINGLKTKDNKLAFPNAEIMVPVPEWKFWMDDAMMNKVPAHAKRYFQNVRRVFGNIGDNTKHFEPGVEVAPGIKSIAAFGHTPGHTVFQISSGKDSLMALCDTSGPPALYVRNPDWHSMFDTDPKAAAVTRKKLFDQAASERMLVYGFHYPFPGTGYIAKDGKGYDFVPSQWSPLL